MVAPIHPKAMPAILTTAEEFDLWLEGDSVEAIKLQRRARRDVEDRSEGREGGSRAGDPLGSKPKSA